jgi:hypothetical protein
MSLDENPFSNDKPSMVFPLLFPPSINGIFLSMEFTDIPLWYQRLP